MPHDDTTSCADSLAVQKAPRVYRCTRITAKLTEGDIPLIWDRLLAGHSMPQIAKDFGVCKQTIYRIKYGTAWAYIARHLPGWPLVPTADDSAAYPVYPAPEFCDDATELWRLIPDWPAYRVSTFGRVQSCWERIRSGGKRQHRMSDVWKDMNPAPVKDGYLQFNVSDEAGRRKGIFVHQAVLWAFAGPCPKGMVCCHKDDNPVNNRASNLRWDTHRANHADWRQRAT